MRLKIRSVAFESLIRPAGVAAFLNLFSKSPILSIVN